MKKGKSITLLTIISVIMAVLITFTFVRFTVPGYKNGTYNYNSIISTLNKDCDISECYVYELTMVNDLSLEEDVTDINSAISVIQRRLDELGYKNYSVTGSKADGTDDYDLRIVVTPNYYNGNESERLALTDSDIQAVVGHGEISFTDADGNEFFDKSELTDVFAYTGVDSSSGEYKEVNCVGLKFTDRAVNVLKNAQGSEEKITLNIKLGDEELFSDSNFTVSNITDNQIAISGYSTLEHAKQKALQIKISGLMYEYEVGTAKVVTPTLGSNASLTSMLLIVAIIVLLVALFAVLYRGFAIPAAMGLVAMVFLQIFFFIAIPGINLSFTSLLGVMLALLVTGYAIYSLFQNVMEEFNSGKTLKAAINVGSKRLLFPLLDIGAVLEIVSIALIIFAQGALRDFAISFGIGVALGTFVSVLFVKWLVKLICPLVKNTAKFFNLSREDN